MPKRLHKKVSIAHSGVYSYLREELPTLGLSEDSIPEIFKDETHFNVYRPASVLAKAAPLFARQPVVVEHPNRLVDPHNAKDLMEGFTGDAVRVAYRNGEAYLDSTLTLIAEDAIRYYEEGYKEVSPGYIMQTRWVSDNMIYKGMPVHILVTAISEVNHLALTVAGRGGPTACVLDSKGESMFLTDLFKAAKNLFTKDSIETAHSLLAELCKTEISAERVGEIIDKVVTLTAVFLQSEEKIELLRFLDDLRFAAELNKEEVQAAVNTVISLYDKLDTAAKAEINNTKETSMPEPKKDPVAEPVKDAVTEPVKDTEPAAESVKDTAVEPVTEPTKDYAPGATGVAGPGSQKMVEDGGFIKELKALIAKYEGAQDAEPVKDAEPKKDEPVKDEPVKDAEPTKDSLPVGAVTATLDSTGSTSGGIDEFMKDFRK